MTSPAARRPSGVGLRGVEMQSCESLWSVLHEAPSPAQSRAAEKPPPWMRSEVNMFYFEKAQTISRPDILAYLKSVSITFWL